VPVVGPQARKRKKIGDKWEKDVFRGNKLNYVWQLKDLVFLDAQNELIFECKRTQIEPQKGRKPTFSMKRTQVFGPRGPLRLAKYMGLHELRI